MQLSISTAVLVERMMPYALSCPNCGASLDYAPDQLVVRCTHCDSSIVIADLLPQTDTKPDPLIPDPTLREVALLLRAGKRVQATIRYREITGADLKEAHLAIERFAQGEPLRRPDWLSR
jgi:DNA-directed RNA polymerase subunit RPC12/RpoP